MILELFLNIVGPVAEKRYPAVRKTIGQLSVIFLASLTLYVGYAFLAT